MAETFDKTKETWKAYNAGARSILRIAKLVIEKYPTRSPLEIIETCERILSLGEVDVGGEKDV